MNIFDEILKKINNFFKRKEQKLLGDGQNMQNTPKKKERKFLDNLKVITQKNNKNIQKGTTKEYDFGTIDDAIDQYLQGLAYNYENGLDTKSYSILTSLFALSNQDKGLNLEKENALVKSIKESHKYRLDVKGKEEPIFYHIRSHNFNNYDKDNIVRLYLNVKRKNVVDLSNELIKSFGDEDFYFKFLADNQMDKVERTESVVIYENKDKINRTLQIIEDIKRQKPEIFEDSEKMGNPFLKKICDGVVSYAPEVDGIYIDNNGVGRAISQTFNTELSVALGESYIEAVNEMLESNKDITKNMNGKHLKEIQDIKNNFDKDNYMRFEDKIDGALKYYAYAYKFISENHKNQLVQKVKENLLNAKKRNPILDIETKESKTMPLDKNIEDR